MALIVKTIGATGRQYATINLWDASVPSNLVTDGNSYEGDMYNDAEFAGSQLLAAHTTNSTHTLLLTAAAGQSFQDNANVRTNALKYNVSNGVGIRSTAGYTNCLST